ncbi:MAG: bifunctional methionine sulfoxide reductase B/A protein [Spirochaetaceae bacterium]
MSKYNKLSKEEEHVIINKGTEAAFSGEYDNLFDNGFYHCRQCDSKLYDSSDKFDSGCGWPSFDAEVAGAIIRKPDIDGRRVEILCHNCGGHLGHVFEGEHLTNKNTRFCVNSLSLVFKAVAYYAGGCFWGVEHLLQKQDGVFSVESGYMGGEVLNPTYEQVCTGDTGHLEVVRVIYNPKKISYTDLTKLFFEIHDPTQGNGQGSDIGSQYLSAIFYSTTKEFNIAKELVKILKNRGLDIVTELLESSTFWIAEDYHQDYYVKHKKEPYCHMHKKLF